MILKSKHSLLLLILFCIIGSFIVSLIFFYMFELHYILAILIFLLLTVFLVKAVYKGNIRKITCREHLIEFHYNSIKCFQYQDIESILVRASEPRRLNSKQRKREIKFIVQLKNKSTLEVPYVSFSDGIYTIIQFIHQKNPSILLDPLSNLSETEYYDTLHKIEYCLMQPSPSIYNNFKRFKSN